MPYSPMDDMEDHHQHQHEQHQQHYGLITDLRQLMNGPPSMHQQPQLLTAELFPGHHRNLPPPLATTSNHHHQHYDMMMFGCDMLPRGLHHHHHEFASTDSAGGGGGGGGGGITTTSVSTPPLSGLEAEAAGCIGGDASTGRWPRQETLTLLEIRSRLDPKFKEANQKGPLWEEVSRIMSEEHGYQRSGKKCREKFENLYKYYKKTKEGKAGRQDGKHYRFFRQLEALYGENSNMSSAPETSFGVNLGFNTSSHFPSQTNQEAMFQSHNKHNCDTISLTNSTEFDTSSSDHNSIEGLIMENIDDSMEKGRKKRKSGGRSWKVKIKDFIDSQMRKLVEKQEEWLHKLVKTLEEKENERVLREEEWRKQEAIRLEKEHKFWAKERAWIEARDAALMGALQKLIGRDEIKAEEGPHEGVMAPHEIRNQNQNEDGNEIVLHSNVIGGADDCWQESEITRLQQFTQSGYSEEVNWEEVANKMACFGYERTALMCKEKWESINNFDAMEGNIKELKGNSRSLFYFENNVQYSLYNSNQGSAYSDVNDQRHNTNK